MGVDAVLLAAGGSRRLGRPKQLLQFEGETLVRRAVRAVLDSGIGELVVVLGANAAEVEKEIHPRTVHTVIHKHWQRGLGTSISVGMRELLKHSAEMEAVLITLCDQPGVGAHQLSSLIRAFEQETHPIVAAGYAGTVGVPAIFDRAFCRDLLALKGDRGARDLLRSHHQQVRVIPMPEAAVDIDQHQDAASLVRR